MGGGRRQGGEGGELRVVPQEAAGDEAALLQAAAESLQRAVAVVVDGLRACGYGVAGGAGIGAPDDNAGKSALLAAVEALLGSLDMEGDGSGLVKAEQIQMGVTKVFLRKQAFEWLEAARARLEPFERLLP